MKALIAAGLGMAVLLLGSLVSSLPAAVPGAGIASSQPDGLSAAALADIPSDLLALYKAAAATCPGLAWTVLAGVGKVETDHGRSNLPGVHSGQNFAGAMGPMQFIASTWVAMHLPGMDNVYDPRDAIFAAAHYLCSNGAGVPSKLAAAIRLYNHSDKYVAQVLATAAQYAGPAVQAAQTVVSAVVHAADPFGGSCRPIMTQPFGPSSLGLEPAVFGFAHFHTGVDLACPGGSALRSVTAGIAHVDLATACDGHASGFGRNVVVEVVLALPGDPSPQRYFIRYGHMASVLIANGAQVQAGTLLGLEGTTGCSTGPHLHFEVDRGALGVAHAVNPAPLLEVTR